MMMSTSAAYELTRYHRPRITKPCHDKYVSRLTEESSEKQWFDEKSRRLMVSRRQLASQQPLWVTCYGSADDIKSARNDYRDVLVNQIRDKKHLEEARRDEESHAGDLIRSNDEMIMSHECGEIANRYKEATEIAAYNIMESRKKREQHIKDRNNEIMHEHANWEEPYYLNPRKTLH